MALEHAIVEILDADAIDGEPRPAAVHPGGVQPDRVHPDQGRADRRDRDPRHRLADPAVRPRPDPDARRSSCSSTPRASGMGDERRRRPDPDRTSSSSSCRIQPKTHAPPRIRFIWGQGLSFKAIVENVDQKFTLFTPGGIPLRATLTCRSRSTRRSRSSWRAQPAVGRPHRARIVRRGRHPRLGSPSRSTATRGLAPDRRRQPRQLDDPRRLPPGWQLVDARPSTCSTGSEATAMTVAAVRSTTARTSTSRPSRCGCAGGRSAKDVVRDVISVTYKDNVEEIDSFEIAINNWDAEHATFKYSDDSCSTRARRSSCGWATGARELRADDHRRDHLAAAGVPGRRAADPGDQRAQRAAPLPRQAGVAHLHRQDRQRDRRGDRRRG